MQSACGAACRLGSAFVVLTRGMACRTVCRAHYQLAMVLLRRCQVPVPAVGFAFEPAVPPLASDGEGGASTASADDTATPNGADVDLVPPAPAHDCPHVAPALRSLRDAGASFEAQRRRERVIEDWQTEVDFWAATLGGKEALCVVSPWLVARCEVTRGVVHAGMSGRRNR